MDRYLLALLAGSLFLLAGLIETLDGVLRHPAHAGAVASSTTLAMGAMFLAVGALWLAIGVRWKRSPGPGKHTGR